MMKKSTLLTSAALTLAAIAALAWAFAPRPIEVEVAQAVVGPFELTIDEDAKTRLAERYVVSAPLAGRLARSALREGDVVEAGAVVATLSPLLSPMLDERTLREQTARVEGADAMLQRARTRIERAKVGIAQVNVELRRNEQLAKDGFIAPTKLETDLLAAQAAQREFETATLEHDAAGHDLEQARAALGVLRQPAAAARDFVVRAPVAGHVLRVLQASEGTVALGTPLVELGDLGQLEVVAQLLTSDALQARPGTPVRIERWGGAAPLAGQVRRVEPAAVTKVSALGVEEQRVNVLIDITSPRAQWQALGDGFRVGVRIVVISAEHALKVPTSAVFPRPGSGQGEMASFVIDAAGRAKQVPVVLSARNGSEAWVSNGLAQGARVVIYPPAAVRDGVRVKERST